MENIKIYKKKAERCIFALALTAAELFSFQIVNLQRNTSRSPQYNFRNVFHSIANIKICKSYPMHFFAKSLTVSEILTFKNFDLQKVDQDQGLQFSRCCHSMANIKIYKRRSFTFFIFLKARPVRTKVADTRSDSNGQSRGYRRNLADLPMTIADSAIYILQADLI